jgi:hypothetical protein
MAGCVLGRLVGIVVRRRLPDDGSQALRARELDAETVGARGILGDALVDLSRIVALFLDHLRPRLEAGIDREDFGLAIL